MRRFLLLTPYRWTGVLIVGSPLVNQFVNRMRLAQACERRDTSFVSLVHEDVSVLWYDDHKFNVRHQLDVDLDALAFNAVVLLPKHFGGVPASAIIQPEGRRSMTDTEGVWFSAVVGSDRVETGKLTAAFIPQLATLESF